MITQSLLNLLVCPLCAEKLRATDGTLMCLNSHIFPVLAEIPILIKNPDVQSENNTTSSGTIEKV